jgi:hypothetical protein
VLEPYSSRAVWRLVWRHPQQASFGVRINGVRLSRDYRHWGNCQVQGKKANLNLLRGNLNCHFLTWWFPLLNVKTIIKRRVKIANFWIA